MTKRSLLEGSTRRAYRLELDDDEPPELDPDDDAEDDPDDEPEDDELDDDADDELDAGELDDVLLELDDELELDGELELDPPLPAEELELAPVGCVTPSVQPVMSPPPTSSVTPVNARRKLRRSCTASTVP